MIQLTRRVLRGFERHTGVGGVVLALALTCAVVLLALYVHILNVSIERGQALRERQRLAQHAAAAPLLAAGLPVSDDRLDAGR